MPLPPVSADKIEDAIVQFDNELRGVGKWETWETNKAHKFAIESPNGRLYPVKEVVSLATGIPAKDFSGGAEANSYVRDRGFSVRSLHLPTESDTRAALHELLLERAPQSVSTQEAYEVLADQFNLPEAMRSETMSNGENHWQNRVRFARRKLVDQGLLDGSETGVWKLAVRPEARVWLEKSHVRDRVDRREGDYAVGKALWSPKKDRGDSDSYSTMRSVQPGDFIVHLVDDKEISGVSKVASYASTDFKGLPNTDWSGTDAYLVRLTDYQTCSPPVNRQAFLGNPNFAEELRRIRSRYKNLFYDRDLNLTQGDYLTPVPKPLVALLNRAATTATHSALPYLDDWSDSTLEPLHTEPASKGVWLYAPGRDAEHWEEFYEDGIIGIGWNELGDLSEQNSLDEMTQHLVDTYGRENPMNDARACFEFAHEMSPGELVFVKRGRGRIIGYGTVLGDYEYDPTRENYQHIRRVRWDGRGDWTSDKFLVMKTLTNISNDDDLVPYLRRLVGLDVDEDEPEVAPVEERAPFTVDDAMKGLFLPRVDLEKALATWKAKKNLIIQGPPGVGKTFIAKRLAYALMGYKDPSRVAMVQFHQSYSYEDFVQGYRPEKEGLALRDGHFLSFCRQAKRDRDSKYVFIIDEINRGNLSRIFGELLMLIEADKRDSAWSMPLTYSQSLEAEFYIPDNVYLLGLMNTADRSLAMVDYAMRRRFAFWTLAPQVDSPAFQQHLLDGGLDKPKCEALVRALDELNREIAEDAASLGPGYQIGHSYFCQPTADGLDPDEWLRSVLETEIVPLLEEYWVDDPGHAERWKNLLQSRIG